MGEDVVKGLEAETGDLQQLLQGAGVESKEVENQKVEPEVEEEAVETVEPEAEPDAEGMKGLADFLKKELGLEELSGYLGQFEAKLDNLSKEVEVLKSLKQNEDEKVDSAVAGIFENAFVWQKSTPASKSEDNLVDETKDKTLLTPPKIGPEEEGQVLDFFFDGIKD